MRRILVVPLLLFAAATPAQGRSWSVEHLSTRIPRAELDAVSDRGRAIAAYDAAAWHGSDALMAIHPAAGTVREYLARQDADGRWEVVFGRLSAASDTFYIAYRAVQHTDDDTAYTAAPVLPAEPDTGYFARAARAVANAARAFGRVTRPYNTVALPIAGEGDWLVYLVPAPTRAGVWPLGADVRYRVSADGRTVLETRRLHNALLEFKPPPPGKVLAAGSHTAVLADRPEDTDVFFVLTRRPRVPEYIVSATFFFRIDVDGRITAYDRDSTPR